MINTQLFRGRTSVAPYPSHVFEELFKLQNITAEPDSTEITIQDPTRLGLPELDGVTAISAINITGEAVDFSTAAAGVLLYGSVEKVPSGTSEDEAHDAYVDRTIRLAKIPLSVTSVTGAGGTPVYVKGVDYSVSPGGIRVLKGGTLAAAINATSAPVDGGLKRLPIEVSYSYPTVDLVKTFTQTRRFYRVLFEQINEAGNGERRRITCFYARISLNGGLPLNQGTEFGTIPVQIRLLPDPEIFEPGEAAIFTMEVQDVDAA